MEIESFFNKIKLPCFIFSYGGCGTNYFRRLLYQFKTPVIEKKTVPIKTIIKSIHINKPPNIIKNNFLAIYIFGDPYLSFYSIFRRKIFSTINILSDKEIYKSSQDVNYNKFLQEIDRDILQFKSNFNNWYNSNTTYPILFINYCKLNKDILLNIKELLTSEFYIKINPYQINKFKERKSNLNNFTQEELDILKNIYGELRAFQQNLPAFWIKYPGMSQKITYPNKD